MIEDDDLSILAALDDEDDAALLREHPSKELAESLRAGYPSGSSAPLS